MNSSRARSTRRAPSRCGLALLLALLGGCSSERVELPENPTTGPKQPPSSGAAPSPGQPPR